MRQYLVVISLKKSYLNHDGEAFQKKKSLRAARGLGVN